MILEVCLTYGIELNNLLNNYNVQQVFSMYEYNVYKLTGKRKKRIEIIDDSEEEWVWNPELKNEDGSTGGYILKG